MGYPIFVIHGRDAPAHSELVKFIKGIGANYLSFGAVSRSLPQPAKISEVVQEGIEQARVVIALLTPDETASLQETLLPGTEPDPDPIRWQPRANVILETGMALGVKKGATIIASLGVKVRLFSDLYGYHVVKLNENDGKVDLLKRIQTIMKDLKDPPSGWEQPEKSGDFVACMRKTWPPHDELIELESALEQIKVRRDSVLNIVQSVVRKYPNERWRRVTTKRFCQLMQEMYGKSVADDVYYWLIERGFFEFTDHDEWFTNLGYTWHESVKFSALATRGVRLIERMLCLPVPQETLPKASRPRKRSIDRG